jgi:hypothetical protein
MPPVNSKRLRLRSDSATANRRLGHPRRAVLAQYLAVRLEAAGGDRLLQLGHVDMCLGDGDRRPDVPAFGKAVGEDLGNEMAPRVERNDLGGIAPLRERPDRLDRRRVGEIGDVDRAELAGGDGEGAIERIGAVMRADDVAMLLARRADDGAANRRIILPAGHVHRRAASRR